MALELTLYALAGATILLLVLFVRQVARYLGSRPLMARATRFLFVTGPMLLSVLALAVFVEGLADVDFNPSGVLAVFYLLAAVVVALIAVFCVQYLGMLRGLRDAIRARLKAS